MVISNSSDSNGTNRSQEILTKSFEGGSRNLTDKAMKMVMATLAVAAGQEENTSATSNGNVHVERFHVHEDRRKLDQDEASGIISEGHLEIAGQDGTAAGEP